MTNKVGEAVRAFRNAHGLSVNDVADRLGYKSFVSIYNLENGKHMTIGTLCAVADLLGVPQHWVGIHEGYLMASQDARDEIDVAIEKILKKHEPIEEEDQLCLL